MAGIAGMIEQLVIDGLLNDHLPLSVKGNTGQGILALFAFFVLLGLGFVGFGAHLWLVAHYSPEAAAVIMGGMSFGLAGLVFATAWLAFRYRQSRIKTLRRGIAKRIQDSMDSLDDEFGESIRKSPNISLLLASMAGFLLEDRIL